MAGIAALAGGPVGAGIMGALDIGQAIASIFGNNAAAKAAKQASDQAVSTDQSVLNTASANLQPFATGGQQALGELSGLLGLGGNPAAAENAFKNYLGSTNYQFLLNQGQASQGYLNAPNLQSGATEKALINYGQGMAGNALGGYEQLLTGQEGLGLNAGTALGQLGNQNAALQQSARFYGANAQGAADVGNANAIGNAFTGLSGILGQGFGGNPFQSSSYGGIPSGTTVPSSAFSGINIPNGQFVIGP